MFSKIDKSRLIAIKNDKILVLEKIGEKKKYSLAGGVKKKKETDIQSLIRETFEEIGLKLKKKELTYFLSRKNNNTKKKEIYKHYFITNTSIKNIEVLVDPSRPNQTSYAKQEGPYYLIGHFTDISKLTYTGLFDDLDWIAFCIYSDFYYQSIELYLSNHFSQDFNQYIEDNNIDLILDSVISLS